VDKERVVAKTLRKTRGSLIGVYSPIHRIGKTKYALELGKELAEKGPVLYLNLEEYAGGEHYFSKEQEQNLGDLLYYSKQETGNLGLRISMMICRRSQQKSGYSCLSRLWKKVFMKC